jgi:ribonuclease HI
MEIHTDGGCERNGQADAVGAWAFVASDGHEESGVEFNTTNNRTELLAVINAVHYAKARGHRAVTIYTDSQLTQLCAIGRWKRKANRDLWQAYDAASSGMSINLQWVRGHSGNAGNERADELCGIAIAGAMQDTSEAQHMRSIRRE